MISPLSSAGSASSSAKPHHQKLYSSSLDQLHHAKMQHSSCLGFCNVKAQSGTLPRKIVQNRCNGTVSVLWLLLWSHLCCIKGAFAWFNLLCQRALRKHSEVSRPQNSLYEAQEMDKNCNVCNWRKHFPCRLVLSTLDRLRTFSSQTS